MKASEVRIGNLVHAFRTTWQIDCTDFRSEDLIATYDPIPLTKEWLERFDFYSKSNLGLQGYIEESEGSFYLWSGTGYFRDYGLEVKIQYVHQLQNLYFALTGEELTIE